MVNMPPCGNTQTVFCNPAMMKVNFSAGASLFAPKPIREVILFRKPFAPASLALLSACTGTGGSAVAFEKSGEIPGTAGLEIAAKECAALEGSREWQACVAHYDGLYTKCNGTIERNYTRSADAPRPSGRIEHCKIKAVWNRSSGTWSYSSCE